MDLSGMNEALLADAYVIAANYHRGQVDKAGRPYIHHPVAVAELVSERGGSTYQQAAALLHDVVEDTPATLEDLHNALVPPRVLEIVDAMTHREGESRREYLLRLKQCRHAVLVKRCDIAHNTEPARLALLDKQTRERLERKYEESLAILDEGETT
jgi:(p)ppGpp synthase/HD superfamily hydrolase